MTNKTLSLNVPLYEYLLQNSLRETDVQRSLRMETAKLNSAAMQIAPEQGQFMALLLQLMRAKRVLELGTFTGYSALCMAMVLPEEGKLVTCDHDQRWIEIASRHWSAAGVLSKIEFKLGRALTSLNEILLYDGENSYDFAFIDADKKQYAEYYELCLRLVRPGGLVVIDNVLWGGDVADTHNQEETTVALRIFNEALRADKRIKLSLVPIGDGLTLALKA